MQKKVIAEMRKLQVSFATGAQRNMNDTTTLTPAISIVKPNCVEIQKDLTKRGVSIFTSIVQHHTVLSPCHFPAKMNYQGAERPSRIIAWVIELHWHGHFSLRGVTGALGWQHLSSEG
jgi:hypothetical protein